MKKTIKILFLLLTAMLIIQNLTSQQSDVYLLDEVEVVSIRNKSLLKNTPEIIRIITKEEISELKANSLGEVLDFVSGINIETGTGGGFPKRAVASLNGLPAPYTLVLLNGTRILSDHIHTGQNLNFIPVESIERIEVVKSSASSQYGSDAIAGVINIITKEAGNEPEAILYGEKGSYKTHKIGASIKTPINNIAGIYSFVEYEESDGIKLIEPASRIDLMGYKTLIIHNRVNVEPLKNFKIDAWLNAINTAMDWTNGINRGTLLIPDLNLEYKIKENLFLSGKAAYTKWESERNSELNSLFRPELWIVYKTKNGSLLGGVDYFFNYFERKAVNRNSLSGIGSYIEYEHNFNQTFILNSAIRFDLIGDLKPVFTPKITGLYNLNSFLKIRAGLNRGFHAPTVQEMYEEAFGHGGTALRFGNPNLKPEYSTSYTLGTDLRFFNKLFIYTSVQYSSVENMIVPVFAGQWAEDPTKDVWRRENILKADIILAEISASYHFIPNYFVYISYSYSDNWSRDNVTQKLPYNAGQGITVKLNGRQNLGKSISLNQFISLNTALGRSAWKWSPASGNPQDDLTGRIIELNDFQKIDAGIGITFNNKYQLYFNIYNILGQEIQYLDDALFTLYGEPTYKFGLKIKL
jgi:outer membrane receptor for ferrienterochelin and colicins